MSSGTTDDVYGALIADALANKRAMEIVERDDGLVLAYDARYLIADFRNWGDPIERRAMRSVRGRVLDVGCGAGRVCLHLQTRGFDVIGIDRSPLAIECCERRGVDDARVLAVDELDPSLGLFDTIVMLGQNFGMAGSLVGTQRLLRRLARITSPNGRIIAETFDPHGLDDPGQRRYLERNQARGRMPGQLRVRVRYRDLATPWFDWLQVSPDELEDLLASTQWKLSRVLGDGPSYVAIIERER